MILFHIAYKHTHKTLCSLASQTAGLFFEAARHKTNTANEDRMAN